MQQARCFARCDSTIVLSWSHGAVPGLPLLMAHKAAQSRSNLCPLSWAHCSRKQIPADILTRGVTAATLQEEEVCFNGRPWLTQLSSCRPTIPEALKHLSDDADKELPSSHAAISSEPYLDPSHCSRHSRLLAVTVFVFCFIRNTRFPDRAGTCRNSVEELSRSENYWVKSVHTVAFNVGFRYL